MFTSHRAQCNIDTKQIFNARKLKYVSHFKLRQIFLYDCRHRWLLRKYGCLSLGSVCCCQEEVPTTGRSLVQRSPTECDVSECNLKT
jgi:hypothetical protein